MRGQAPERVQKEHQWQAGLQLPFRFALNSPAPPERGKRESFFRERVRKAIGSLLKSWTRKHLISNAVSIPTCCVIAPLPKRLVR